MKDKRATPRVNKWLDAVEKILQAQGIPLAQVARDIGRADRYIQVLKWVRYRHNEPGGEITLQFVEWALRHDPELVGLFGVNEK